MNWHRHQVVIAGFFVSLISLGLAACNAPIAPRDPTPPPQELVKPVPIRGSGAPTIESSNATLQSAVYPPETRTGIAALDAIIDAVLDHDIEELRGLTQYAQLPCTHADGLGGQPKCLEGEEENTIVAVVPYLGAEGGHLRRAEFEALPGPDVRGLLAVYRVSPTAFSEDSYPAGEHALVFLDAGGTSGVILQERNGRVVRYDFPLPGSLQSRLETSAAEFILPLSDYPVPTAVPWNTFEDPMGRFSFFVPPTMAVNPGSGENSWVLGDRIIFAINPTNAYWVGCLEQPLGDCPIVNENELVEVNGLRARRLKGWFGAIGGRIPQEYLTYIFEVEGEYLVFTLYALPLDLEPTDMTTVWPVEGMHLELFERSLGTLTLFD
jgi:hypothetical protein